MVEDFPFPPPRREGAIGETDFSVSFCEADALPDRNQAGGYGSGQVVHGATAEVKEEEVEMLRGPIGKGAKQKLRSLEGGVASPKSKGKRGTKKRKVTWGSVVRPKNKDG